MIGWAALAVAAIGAPAAAQLLGGRVSLPSAPSLPSVPSAPTVTTPSVPSSVDSARQTVDEATAAARSVGADAPKPEVYDLQAGESTWVNRGTRCHYVPDNSYYDPVYRDGYYWCEPRKTGVSAGVTVSSTPH